MTKFDSSNLTMKINGVEVSGFSNANEGKGFLSRNIVIKRSQLHMTELENKFIMMSRIAVALGRKGFIVSLMILPKGLSMFVHFDGEIVDSLDEYNITEAELLEWWAIIEG